jgi:RNA polymerase sigma-70 factor (ECF subfamily)
VAAHFRRASVSIVVNRSSAASAKVCEDGGVAEDQNGLVVDERTFQVLAEQYRGRLEVHCYRLLGSVEDAEDIVQETLLAAWQGLGRFEGRSSLRTWLYRIATNRCLNARRARRSHAVSNPPVPPELPQPNATREAVWLDPYPDSRLEAIPDLSPGPEAKYEATQAISLAFVTALQLLPPRQRAVLVLRDVLGFHANEVAQMLDSSTESVTSALKRARAGLRRRAPQSAEDERPPAPNSPVEQRTVDALTRAYESGNLEGVVALLTHDVAVAFPLAPTQYEGRDLVAQFLQAMVFRPGISYRLVRTRANGQPAFGVYIRDPHARVAHSNGVLVLTMAAGRIRRMTRFDNGVLIHFGLPRTLPD